MANKDFSLIDANFGRAREGLRVIEEIARFIIKDRNLFENCKSLRHKLADYEYYFGCAHTVGSRIGVDLGKDMVVDAEYERGSSFGIIRASAGRTSQSLRVLEEYAKVYVPRLAIQIEDLRYKLYTLEYRLLEQTPHYYMYRYFKEGVVYPLVEDEEECKKMIHAGAKIIQIRDKESSRSDLYQKAKRIAEFVEKLNTNRRDKVLLIINDHPEIAAELPVAGVHLGQGDGTIQRARRLMGSNKIIGRSNHSVEHIEKSERENPDYVSIGPVFETPLKPDKQEIGLEVVESVVQKTYRPVVAIGGINAHNVHKVRQAGVLNVAAIREAEALLLTYGR